MLRSLIGRLGYFTATFTLGADFSWYQGLVDWVKGHDAGLRYAFIRAGSIDNSSGECYTDYQFERNADLAPMALDHVGYYWYFRPNHDPQKQADYFTDLIEDKEWTLPPVVDVEEQGGKTPRQVADALSAFLADIRTSLSIMPIIYMRQSQWDNIVAPANWKVYPLWIARWNYLLSGPWADGYFKPRDWDDWVFWQYSSKGNHLGAKYGAQSTDLDMDRFNGDEQALDAFVQKYGRPKEQPLTWGQEVNAALFELGGYSLPQPPEGI